MTVLVGVSGKIGAGKNYLADRVIDKMRETGLKVDYTSFAAPLKAELDAIIAFHRKHAQSRPGVTQDEISDAANAFSMPEEQVLVLLNYIAYEVEQNPLLNSYSRTPGIRSGLQYLGSDIRRAQNASYWVDKLGASIGTEYDYLFATDTRFPNEADFVLAQNGVVIRLEVPIEVILSRTNSRDGLKYSEEALNHQSETALDDYPNFDFYVGETFITEDVYNKIAAIAASRQP